MQLSPRRRTSYLELTAAASPRISQRPEGCAALVAAEPMADILVNNVGIHGPQDFFEIPDAEWTPYCPKTAWQVP